MGTPSVARTIRFTDTKHGEEVAKHLTGFQGRLLVADTGFEFNMVARENELVRAGCWSHRRRRFFEARTYHPRECTLALGVVRDLFAIEASIRDADLDTRRAVRDRGARPLVTVALTSDGARRGAAAPTTSVVSRS